MTRRGNTILAVLALSNLFGYAIRNSLFAVYDDLRAQFHFNDATIGLLATWFLIPHALATLPYGWLGDRFDRRRVIASGLVLAAAASAAGALAGGNLTLAITRALVGLGTAAIVPISNSIIAQLFEPSLRASRMSFFNLGMLFGGVVGFFAGTGFGFPAVVIVLAVPCLVCAVVVVMISIPPHPGPQKLQPSASGQLIAGARAFWRIRTLRYVMLSTTAMAFASGGYIAWLLDFLKSDKHMSEGAATTLLSVTGIGAVAGVITGGRLADRVRRRTPAGRLWVIALGMGCSIPSAAACIMLPAGPALYAAGIVMMFFFSWYHAPVAISVDDLAPPTRVAAAQGLVIFVMHLVGTAPSSFVVGLVADRTSLYTAMWVPTCALAIAAVAMLLATPSFARDHQAARGAAAVL